jgi:hypothetical protein
MQRENKGTTIKIAVKHPLPFKASTEFTMFNSKVCIQTSSTICDSKLRFVSKPVLQTFSE